MTSIHNSHRCLLCTVQCNAIAIIKLWVYFFLFHRHLFWIYAFAPFSIQMQKGKCKIAYGLFVFVFGIKGVFIFIVICTCYRFISFFYGQAQVHQFCSIPQIHTHTHAYPSIYIWKMYSLSNKRKLNVKNINRKKS